MTPNQQQNLDEIRLAYRSNHDVQWLIQQLAAAEQAVAGLREALDIVMPMAEQWAEGGGRYGPEMHDFERAQALIAAAAPPTREQEVAS